MTDERKIRVLKSTLSTILLESNEPIIKAMAESALSETIDFKEVVIPNSCCTKHNWFGLPDEGCPMCIKEWDGQCVCGHKHSEHNPVKGHNYSAGHCTIGECRCKHFLNSK